MTYLAPMMVTGGGIWWADRGLRVDVCCLVIKAPNWSGGNETRKMSGCCTETTFCDCWHSLVCFRTYFGLLANVWWFDLKDRFLLWEHRLQGPLTVCPGLLLPSRFLNQNQTPPPTCMTVRWSPSSSSGGKYLGKNEQKHQHWLWGALRPYLLAYLRQSVQWGDPCLCPLC